MFIGDLVSFTRVGVNGNSFINVSIHSVNANKNISRFMINYTNGVYDRNFNNISHHKTSRKVLKNFRLK